MRSTCSKVQASVHRLTLVFHEKPRAIHKILKKPPFSIGLLSCPIFTRHNCAHAQTLFSHVANQHYFQNLLSEHGLRTPSVKYTTATLVPPHWALKVQWQGYLTKDPACTSPIMTCGWRTKQHKMQHEHSHDPVNSLNHSSPRPVHIVVQKSYRITVY